jgi:D-arabinose 1-dehydrogenase-like Zn-dependent alcohol dehydrogenase
MSGSHSNVAAKRLDATMRVVELPAIGAPLRPATRPVPEPGPGEVRVEVKACGVCGSDVFLQDGGFVQTPLPIVPGHEAAGLVDAVGPGVQGIAVGALVALYYISTPPGDAWAAAGMPNRSPAVQRMGVDVDGAFAEYVVRPSASVIVPARPLPPAELAVLTDAVATPLHALRRIAKLSAGETVAIIGIGGIGSNAVQLAKAFGATVISISRTAQKLELAGALGSDHVVSATGDVVAAVRELTGGVGADVVLQCAGSAQANELAVDLAAPGGRVVLVGASTTPFRLHSMRVIWSELALLGSRGFVPADIEEAIELRLDGKISLEHLVGTIRPLAEAQEALEDLRNGRVLRTVLIP